VQDTSFAALRRAWPNSSALNEEIAFLRALGSLDALLPCDSEGLARPTRFELLTPKFMVKGPRQFTHPRRGLKPPRMPGRPSVERGPGLACGMASTAVQSGAPLTPGHLSLTAAASAFARGQRADPIDDHVKRCRLTK